MPLQKRKKSHVFWIFQKRKTVVLGLFSNNAHVTHYMDRLPVDLKVSK